MPPTFSFDVDTDRNLVRVVMAGFFLPEDVDRFLDARNLAHEQLRCGPNQHLTLVDIRDIKIQSQEAVAAFSRLFRDPCYFSRKIAIIVSQSLARTQVKRAAAGRDINYFTDDVRPAEQWLMEDH